MSLSRSLAALALSSVLLGGCGWFGEEEAPPLPGKRISVMLLESDLEPDRRLADLKVTLPKPYENESWPQNGGYSDHAMHHLAAPASLDVAWSVSIGDGGDEEERLLNTPIVAERRVFTMDVDYELRAFDIGTGNLVWSSAPEIPDEDDEAFGGGLAYHNGRLFMSTGFADVVAFDAKDGTQLWTTRLTGPMRSGPTASGDTIYVITLDNQLFALNAETGERLWNHSGFSEVAGLLGGSSPAVAKNMIVAPYSSGELYALRARNGRVSWSDNLTAVSRADAVSTLADIRGAPVVDRGLIYAISHSGRMAAIDAGSGARVWDRRIAGTQTPWIAGEFLYLVTTDGFVACLTRRGGRVKWLTPLPDFEDPEERQEPINWVGPVLAGDRLVLGNNIGEIWSLSPYDGKPLGKIDVGGSVRVPPVVSNGTLFIQTEEGRLTAFR